MRWICPRCGNSVSVALAECPRCPPAAPDEALPERATAPTLVTRPPAAPPREPGPRPPAPRPAPRPAKPPVDEDGSFRRGLGWGAGFMLAVVTILLLAALVLSWLHGLDWVIDLGR